jgi:hypothetical protein
MAVIKQDSSNSSNLIADDRALSEETIIALKKLEYDHKIGRLGLQGTLAGACAAFFLIVLIVFAPIVTKKEIVEGWQLVIIVALVAGSVLFYGAFVFHRTLSLSGDLGGKKFNFSSPAPVKQLGVIEEKSDTATIKILLTR